MFKRRILSSAAMAGLICISAPASASTVDVLNIISSSTIGSGILGTVTLTQNGANEVDVAVALIGASFVDTGGPHNAFTFNLDLLTPYTIAITSPTGNIFSVGSTGSNTPFGSFTNVINCPGCGPGGSNANAGPLNFMVTDLSGISISDFTKNSGGFYFAADVIGPNGGTGAIAAAPLPAALPLFASGLGALGLFGWWRKRKNAAAGATA